MIVLDRDDLQSATELLEDTFGTVIQYNSAFTLEDLDIGLTILVDDAGYVVRCDNFSDYTPKPCNTITSAVQHFIDTVGAL